MRISDWSSDVCSSDLLRAGLDVAAEDSGASLNRIVEMGAVGDRIERRQIIEHVEHRRVEGELVGDWALRGEIERHVIVDTTRPAAVAEAAIILPPALSPRPHHITAHSIDTAHVPGADYT